MSMIHVTAEEPPWDPSIEKYSEHETQTSYHQGQIILPATVARGPAVVIAIIANLLAYDATDITDDDNHVIALSALYKSLLSNG